jgi:hypothetical protein
MGGDQQPQLGRDGDVLADRQSRLRQILDDRQVLLVEQGEPGGKIGTWAYVLGRPVPSQPEHRPEPTDGGVEVADGQRRPTALGTGPEVVHVQFLGIDPQQVAGGVGEQAPATVRRTVQRRSTSSWSPSEYVGVMLSPLTVTTCSRERASSSPPRPSSAAEPIRVSRFSPSTAARYGRLPHTPLGVTSPVS